jgi:hypothetical protein
MYGQMHPPQKQFAAIGHDTASLSLPTDVSFYLTVSVCFVCPSKNNAGRQAGRWIELAGESGRREIFYLCVCAVQIRSMGNEEDNLNMSVSRPLVPEDL